MTAVDHFPLPLAGEFTDNGRRLTLTRPFVFIDGETRIDVPTGFVTDFNSSPRGTWNIFPPWEYPEAAVVHDYGYRHPGRRSRAWWDGLHSRALQIAGCPRWKRWAARSALWAGGWKPWNRYRTEDRPQ